MEKIYKISVKMRKLFAIVAFLLIVNGCNQQKNVKKDEDRLAVRLKAYTHALTVHDFDGSYMYECQENKSKIAYDDYLKDKWSSNAESEVYEVSSVKYDKVKDEYLVKIKAILVNLPESVKISIFDIRGEVWKFENGDWFRCGVEKKTLSDTASKE